jgi:hypothetical protein
MLCHVNFGFRMFYFGFDLSESEFSEFKNFQNDYVNEEILKC